MNKTNPQNHKSEIPPFSLRRVFKGASIYSLGEVLIKASGFFLIPIFTRFLTPADYGIIGYLQVFLQIATVIISFGFHGAQTRYYYEYSADTEAMGRFSFTINFVPFAIALFVWIPLTLLGSVNNWTVGTSNIPFSPFMTLTLWTVILQVLASNTIAYYRARQQFATTVFLNIAQFSLVTFFSILFIVGYNKGALGRVAGIFVGMLIYILISFSIYARHFVYKPSMEALKYAATFGAPIVVHLLAGTIHNAIDRVMLDRYVSLDQLGIYTLAFTIGNVMTVFFSAFNQAYQPSFFQLMSSKRKDIEYQIIRIFKLWLIIITTAASFGILLGGPFLRIFAGKRFVSSIEVFPWIILAMYLGGFYFFFSSSIFYFKKTKYLPVITGASALTNICLNLIFIPRWGIIGAAVSSVISHVVTSVLSLVISNKLYKIRWPYVWIMISCSIVLLSLVFVKIL